MTKTASRTYKFISIILAVLMLTALLPMSAPAHAAGSSVTPGGSVSGTLSKSNSIAEYTVSGMTVSDYWGIRLTMKISGTSMYEIWLSEATPDYSIPGLWDTNFITEFYPSSQSSYLTKTSDGFVYKSPVAKYAIEEYKYTISIPEYMWEDMPSSATFDYTLELYQEGTPQSSFYDVSAGDWYYNAVSFAVDKGLFQGTSETMFSPNVNMTRGMLVTVLGRMAGVNAANYSGSDFSDVNASMYYAPYVKWAASLGLVNGTGDGRFSPDVEISRQDLVTVLYRYVSSIGGDNLTISTGPFYQFSDYSDTGSYATDAMKWATSRGILNGDNGKLRPRDYATRAQVAQIFYNAYDLLNSGAEEPSKPSETGNIEELAGALEELIGAFGGDGSLSDDELGQIFDYIGSLEKSGDINDVEWSESAVLFTTADGFKSGFTVTQPYSDDGEPLIGSLTSGGSVAQAGNSIPTAMAMDSDSDKVYLPNEKVLYISAFEENDYSYSYPMKSQLQEIRAKGYDVTAIYGADVDDFANMGGGGYGLIIIYAHGSIIGDKFYLSVEDWDYDYYEWIRMLGFVDTRGVIEVRQHYDNTYKTGLSVLLEPEFVAGAFSRNPSDGAYVHLVSCSSMANNTLSNALIGAGIKSVTGYSDVVLVDYASKALNVMAIHMLETKNQQTPEIDIKELETAVYSMLGTNAFWKEGFNIATNTTERRAVLTRMSAAGGTEQILGAEEKEDEPPPPSDLPVQIISGSFELTSIQNTMASHRKFYTITFTVRNNGSVPITGIQFNMNSNVTSNTPIEDMSIYPNDGLFYSTARTDIFGISAIPPGETATLTFNIMRTTFLDTPDIAAITSYGIVITGYSTDDTPNFSDRTKVDPSDYALFVFP